MYNHNNHNNYNHNNYNKNNYNKNNYYQNNYSDNTIIIKGSWTNTPSTSTQNPIEKKSYSKYRNSHNFYDRLNESIRIIEKYPDRIPVICEKGLGANNPDIYKNKFLVPLEFNLGNFLVVIRKLIKLQNHEALFLMINGTVPPLIMNFKELYWKYKDPDGHLYITYSKENVFG
jgi:GABA(A) receptor-associated protein